VTLVSLQKLRVIITVSERDATGVTLGKRAHVELDALPNKTFSGQVTRMAPSFDPVTRTLDAQVLLTNETGELRPGMYGRGSIVLDVHPRAVTVPATALQITSGKYFVYVLAGTKVERRPVEIGVDEGAWLEVTSGLSSTDEVVIAGADGLSDGATVRPIHDIDPYRGPQSSSAAPPAPSAGSTRPD
jgi:RND family efflux transporter MFP subunit